MEVASFKNEDLFQERLKQTQEVVSEAVERIEQVEDRFREQLESESRQEIEDVGHRLELANEQKE